ncbi:hypothetical protein GOBAR_AA08245 [Gossypium barbadense]|uniref:Uncharacterized protein n=1 Tax=Gossypium barbadense TaxID=3634 RepID=A0A2P5Y9Z3_GOSBA|nr:hypothetical protein GOBAR_AA08245 [Gossypium barbadense]
MNSDFLKKGRSCPATILRPCALGVCGTLPYCMVVPSLVHFSHARVLGYHARVLLSTASRHGRVSCPCRRNRIEPCPWHTRVFPFPRPYSPIKFTHGHVARPWGFIASYVLGKSCPASTRPYRMIVFLSLLGHGLRHARVPGRALDWLSSSLSTLFPCKIQFFEKGTCPCAMTV